jgi:predicted transcriptional regulator
MSPQAGFLLQDQIIPRLKSAVPQVVNCVGLEDPSELVQDATAFAANMIQNAELAGKRVVQSAGSRGARKVRCHRANQNQPLMGGSKPATLR